MPRILVYDPRRPFPGLAALTVAAAVLAPLASAGAADLEDGYGLPPAPPPHARLYERGTWAEEVGPRPVRPRAYERVEIEETVPVRPIRPPVRRLVEVDEAVPVRPYPPVSRRVVEVEQRGEVCRVVLKPRLDPLGREVVHQVRICDDGPVGGPRAAWRGPPSRYSVEAPGRFPLPPREIGPDLDGEPG